jgi:peptidoglycan-associated lipoprotein
MKGVKLLVLLMLLLAFAAGAGCSKKPVASSTAGQGMDQSSSDAELAARNLEEAKRIIVNEKVYFALDSFAINEQSKEILKRKAEVLRGNSKLKVIIEGNCDERGTAEYNLALGERRAMAAKKYLSTMGVSDYQLETVSYGKERPADPGHNESAWSLNRRDEFRLVW